MAIQMRRGADSDFDASKMLPGEIAVTTDGTRKVYAAFGTNDAKELASKDDVQRLINSFTSVVDREIAEAEQRIESKAETVLGTIPDEYEVVSKKADEAVRTKADAIVCTVSGVTPIATDSSDDYIRNLKVYGKTTQETTSGKNLFDYETHVSNGYVSTIYVEPNRTLYRNAQLGVSANWVLYDTDGNSLGTFIDLGFDSANNPLVLPSNASYIVSTDKKVFSELYIGYDSDTTFEPYTGGIASPSPQYSQPLESKGKWGNLFSGLIKGKIINASTGVESDNTIGASTDYILVNFLENEYYYLWGLSANLYSFVSYYDEQKTYLARTKASPYESILLDSTSLTASVDKSRIAYIRCCVTENENTTGTIDLVDSLKIMLNTGTTALPYRPYSGQREIESGVLGKNLIPYPYRDVTVTRNGVTFTVNSDRSITVNGTASAISTFNITFNSTMTLPEGVYCLSGCPNGGGWDSYILDLNGGIYADTGHGKTITLTEKTTITQIRIRIASGATLSNITFKPQLEFGTIATEYEPYTKQSHISLVSDGLKGIPVTDASLATYTDENGQMWCSDYVDCDKGVLVQRVYTETFDGSDDEIWNAVTTSKYWYVRGTDIVNAHLPLSPALCTHFRNIDSGTNEDYFMVGDNYAIMLFLKNYTSDGTEFRQMLATSPITVQYILETPIETPLTASEIESYKALRSNYKVTTVMNDCDAHTEVTYNADTETWINNKIEAKVATALASLAL